MFAELRTRLSHSLKHFYGDRQPRPTCQIYALKGKVYMIGVTGFFRLPTR